jgi:hypothetical protein
MYQGTLFKKSVLYCKKLYPQADIYILSAKYGLISFDTKIEPYELNLCQLSEENRIRWYAEIQQALENNNISLEHCCFLTSSLYQGSLQVLNPLKGMSIGRRLQFLNSHIRNFGL